MAFVFFLGDLVISSFGEFAELDSVLKDWRCVLDSLAIHNIAVFACRGNNDFSREAWDSLFTGNYALPQNGPADELNITYSFEWGNLCFISLDQYVESHRINQAWLDEQLAANKKPVVFVAAHEPAFKLLHSNCMAAYPDERNSFWESLISAGVNIYFCGHDHFYDHAVIDDSDGNPDNDVHQVIVGTGSALHSDSEYNGDNGRWTPVCLFHEQANGYVLVEVNESEVKLTWKHRVDRNVFEDGGDSFRFITLVAKAVSSVRNFQLFQNYSNPFNSTTTIRYLLAEKTASHRLSAVCQVELSIYNLLGQKVVTVVSEKQPAGNYTVEWDASDFPSGVYFYRLSTDKGFSDIKKMIVLK